MKSYQKKILCLVICISMLFSSSPIQSHATDTDEKSVDSIAEQYQSVTNTENLESAALAGAVAMLVTGSEGVGGVIDLEAALAQKELTEELDLSDLPLEESGEVESLTEQDEADSEEGVSDSNEDVALYSIEDGEEDDSIDNADDSTSTVSITDISLDNLKASTSKKEGASDYGDILVNGHISFKTNEAEDKSQAKDALSELLNNTKYVVDGVERAFEAKSIEDAVNEWVNKSDNSFQLNINVSISYKQQSKITVSCGTAQRDISVTKDPQKKELETPGTPSSITGKVGETLSIQVSNANGDIYADLYDGDQLVTDTASKGVRISVDNAQKKVNLYFIHAFASKNYTLKIYTKKDGDKVDQSKSISIAEIRKADFGIELKNAPVWVKGQAFEVLIEASTFSTWLDIIAGVKYDIEIKMQDKADPTAKAISIYSTQVAYNTSRNAYVITIPKDNYSKLTEGKEYNLTASIKNGDWNINPVIANTSVRPFDLSYTLVTDKNGQISYPYTDASGNKWTKDNVVFKMGDNCTGYVAYKAPGSGNWTRTGSREFSVNPSWSGQDICYTYYASEDELNGYVTENRFKVYMDQDKPAADHVDVQLYNYNNNVQGMVEDAPANEFSVHGTKQVYLVLSTPNEDKTGFAKITMHYGSSKSLDLTKVNVAGLSSKQYVFVLNKDALYKDVKFTITDGVGNESELIPFGKNISVTINSLDVSVDAKTASGDGYYGQLVSEAVNYTITLKKYESDGAIGTGATYTVYYKYTDKNDKNIVETGKKVKFVKQGNDLVATITIGSEESCLYNGNVSFVVEKTIKDDEGQDVTNKILQNNGTLRERGIYISKVKMPSDFKVTLSYEPDSATGWYNVEVLEKHQGKMVELMLPQPKKAVTGSTPKTSVPALSLVYVIYKQNEGQGNSWHVEAAYEVGYRNGSSFRRDLCSNRVENYTIPSALTYTFAGDGVYSYAVYYVQTNQDDKNDFGVKYQYQDVVAYAKQQYVAMCPSDKPVKINSKVPENLQLHWGDVSLVRNQENGNEIIFSKDSMNIEGSCEGGDHYFFKIVEGTASIEGNKDFPAFNEYSENNRYTVEPCKKGYVVMFARNEANNKSFVVGKKIVVDNVEPKGEITASSNPNKNGYYNTVLNLDVNVTDEPTDAYSGIKEISYTLYVDDAPVETDVKVDLANASTDSDGLVASYKFPIKLDPEKHVGTEYKVIVKILDNAENPAEIVSEVYKLDAKAPEIAITYDPTLKQADETYINSNVTATITVTEKNFDPNGFKMIVTKDGVSYPVTIPANSWVIDKAKETNVAKVVLKEDGKYVVTAECIDLADNKAEYDKKDTFIIDMTDPKVVVTYNNNDARNEVYYNKERTATITVTEENFDEKLFVLNMDGSVQPTVGKWSNSGSTHTMTIQFSKDGSYEWSLKGADLAGNEAEEYVESKFYIDTVLPTIEISGVEDRSANAGDVNPIVLLEDENFDAEGVSITLTNSKGVVTKLSESKKATTKGYYDSLTNVNEQEDEIYTLLVTLVDLAGNESKQEIRFSLNRNGSAYDLSEIEALMEKVYIRYEDMDDVNVYEMNVDEIESFTIFMSRNGEMMMNVRNGNRPTIIEHNTVYYMSKESGSDEKGYEYQYTIFKENFQEEGMYNITLYSKDRAGNEVNSTLTDKGAEIIFVIDNTKPEVVLSGIPVKPGEYFKADQNQINVVFTDNFMLEDAIIQVINKNNEPIVEYNYLEEVSEAGDVFSFTLDTQEEFVTIAYKASDKAGNVISVMIDENTAIVDTISEPDKIITKNTSSNKWWIILIVLVCAAGGGYGYVKKKNGGNKQSA